MNQNALATLASQTAAAQSDAAAQPAAAAAAAAATPQTVTAGTTATTATLQVSTPVGSPNWATDFSNKVVFLSNAHQQTAQLTLNPPDLGPLQVVLQVSGTHAHAVFVSEHQQVRDAIEQALPKLREQFAAGGMGLGSASVNDGSSNSSSSQSGSGNGNRRSGSGDTGAASTTETATAVATRAPAGVVDTFV